MANVTISTDHGGGPWTVEFRPRVRLARRSYDGPGRLAEAGALEPSKVQQRLGDGVVAHHPRWAPLRGPEASGLAVCTPPERAHHCPVGPCKRFGRIMDVLACPQDKPLPGEAQGDAPPIPISPRAGPSL